MVELGLDLAKTAVLTMDFQRGIISEITMAQERRVVDKAKTVLDSARMAGVPVVHVIIQFREGYPEVSSRNQMFSDLKQMGLFLIGHDETMIDESLGPVKGDIVVSRPRVNAFYNSDLQSILSSKEVHTLVLMGIATEWVVEATARHAADADYRVIILEDCCAGMSVESHNSAIAHTLDQIGKISTSEEFLTNLK